MIEITDETVASGLRRFATALHVPPDLIDDLVQAVWADVMTRLTELHRTRNDPDFWTWLFVVIRNKVIDAARREHRHPTRSFHTGESEQRPATAESGPVGRLDTKEDEDTIHVAMAELKKEVSAINFRIMTLFFYGDMKIAEIAKAIDLTPNKVSQRKKRMLKRLRVLIEARRGKDFGDDWC